MIDWSRVNELKDEIGEEDFAEVAEMFLEEVHEVVARLKSDPVEAELEQDMHFLKSSALNLGFQSFSTLCGKHEESASAGNFDTIELPSFFAEYEASKKEFVANI